MGTLDFPFQGDQLVLGRQGGGAHVELNWDSRVSRNHAQVWFHEGRAWIRDLGSSNGTWLGGERIQQPVPLDLGVVMVGETVVTLVEEPAPSVAGPGMGVAGPAPGVAGPRAGVAGPAPGVAVPSEPMVPAPVADAVVPAEPVAPAPVPVAGAAVPSEPVVPAPAPVADAAVPSEPAPPAPAPVADAAVPSGAVASPGGSLEETLPPGAEVIMQADARVERLHGLFETLPMPPPQVGAFVEMARRLAGKRGTVRLDSALRFLFSGAPSVVRITWLEWFPEAAGTLRQAWSEARPDISVPIASREDAVARFAARNRKVVAVADAGQMGAEICCPLLREGEPVAVLRLDISAPAGFTPPEFQFVRAAAALLAEVDRQDGAQP